MTDKREQRRSSRDTIKSPADPNRRPRVRGEPEKQLGGTEPFYPLTSAQRAMLSLSEVRPAKSVLVTVETAGPIEPAPAREAFAAVQRRTEIFRTAFECDHEMWRVVVAPRPRYILEVRVIEDKEGAEEAFRLAVSEFAGPIDPAGASLIRGALVLGPAQAWLLFAGHPAICDASTMEIAIRNFARAYDDIAAGRQAKDKVDDVYRHVISGGAAERLANAPDARAMRARLLRRSTSTPSRIDRATRSVVDIRGDLVGGEILLGEEATHGLRALAVSLGATTSTVILGALAGTLAVFEGYGEVTVGVPIDVRSLLGAEGAAGPLTHVLPLPFDVSRGTDFRDLVGKARDLQTSALRCAGACLTRFDLPHDAANSPRGVEVFSAFFSAQRLSPPLSIAGRPARVLYPAHPTTSCPLMVFAPEREDTIVLAFEYDEARIDHQVAASIAQTVQRCLAGTGNGGRRLSALTAAPLDGRELRIGEGPAGRTGDVVRELVAALSGAGDRTAVRYGDECVRAKDLLLRARHIAAGLRHRGIGSDDVVALNVPLAPAYLEMLLGVLMAGAAYLPLDSTAPPSRQSQTLNEACPAMVVGASPTGCDGAWQHLTPEALDGITPASDADLVAWASDPTALAYVIATSGSTGAPKAVEVTRAGLWNYLAWARDTYRAHDQSGCAVISSPSVDLTVTSLLLPLVSAGAVWLPPAGEVSASAVLRAARAQPPVSAVKATPSHLEFLLSAARSPRIPWATLVVGGESLPTALVENVRWLASGSLVFNEYGPTEATVGCVVHPVEEPDLVLLQAPIGHPIDGCFACVLDEELRPLPFGAVGELCLGGTPLARGYRNRPALTAEAFVPDPFHRGQRLYRTGDLVRWDREGLLYLGRRKLDQVKINGHRLELGDVEAAMRRVPGVTGATVRPGFDAAGRVTHLEASLVGTVSPEDITDRLREILPPYAIPSQITTQDSVRLRPGGKRGRDATAEQRADGDQPA